jgi:hypothetical protein
MVAAMKMVMQVMDLYFAIVAMMSFGSFAAAAVALTAFQAMVKTLLKAVVKKQLKKKRAKKRKKKKRTECDCGKKKKTRQGQRSQEECGPKLRLESVRFIDSLPFYKDQAGKITEITGEKAQWQDTKKPYGKPEINEHIGYVSSESGDSKKDCEKKTATCLTITAKFKVTRLPEKWKDKSITIRGKISGSSPDNEGTEKLFKTELRDTIKLPKKPDGLIEIKKVMSENALPSKITQYYNPMTIKWKLSYGKEVDEIQTSKHQVYVTLNKPGNKPSELYLTLLHLATSNPGATNEADAAWKTWQLFANVEKPDIGSKSLGPKGVKNWDDIPLAYYPDGQGLWECATIISLKDFLTNNKEKVIAGKCGNFSKLFGEVLRVNNINSHIFEVVPKAESQDFRMQGLMLIKHWNFGKESYPNDKKGYKWHFYRYKSSMVSAVKAGEAGDNGTTYGAIQNILDGIPGQNVETPFEKAFGEHGIVKIELDELQQRPYFDPAYGKTYSNEQDFENQAVDGYAKAIYQADGKTPVFYHYTVRRSKGLNNILFRQQ